MGTIATHNGSKVSFKHNKRDKSVVSKEEHIDPDGVHENIINRDIKKVYAELFGEAVREYNKKQKRKDRQIKNYYSKICKDKKKHSCYEIIVGVYGDDSTPEQKEEILKKYAADFEERNPNLKVVGIYYHDDEIDPNTKRKTEKHLHVDYVPFYHAERGLGVQQGLTKALQEQGIEPGQTIKETAQILWQRKENAYLEQLCNEKGISIEHPLRNADEKRKHLETDIYKLQKTQETYSKMSNSVEIYEKGQRFDNLKELDNKYKLELMQQSRELQQVKQENKKLKQVIDFVDNFIYDCNLKETFQKYKKNKQNQRIKNNDFEK